MSDERRRVSPYTIGGLRPDGTAAPVGPWWTGRGVPDARPAGPELAAGDGDDWHGDGNGKGNSDWHQPDHPIGGFVDPEDVDESRGMGAGMPFAVIAGAV